MTGVGQLGGGRQLRECGAGIVAGHCGATRGGYGQAGAVEQGQ
ncbi:hypothetical protein [Amycolatopsis sp.]|jgi:hypothetical protein|nr:hypothetical protein [Amycolatopsis sp.]